MPTPSNKKALLRFLGICNFITQYIPHLSDAYAPLREISNRSSEFSWSSTQQMTFDKVKEKVAKASKLQYFNPKVPVTLLVDASDYGIGAALLQERQPVAYSSTTLSQAEKNNLHPNRKIMLGNRPCHHKVGPMVIWLPPHHCGIRSQAS